MLAGILAALVYESLLRTTIDERAYELPPRVCNLNCCSIASHRNVKEDVIIEGNYPSGGFASAKYRKTNYEF